MTDELKPCPFCGGEARDIEPAEAGSHWFKHWRIRCASCGAMTAGTHRRMNREAWNRRAERACRNVGGGERAFMCSECGGYTHGSPFHPSDEDLDRLAAALSEFEGIDGGRIVSVHSGVPRFCPNCGARVVEP